MKPSNEMVKKVALIGGGVNSAVGRAHLSALRMDGLFEIWGGCFSRSPTVNRQSAEAYGISADRLFDSVELLLEQCVDACDAVIVLTPTNQHCNQVIQCIQAGLPVVCEKSLTATPSEARALIDSLQKRKGFISVTFNYTGYPALREIRQRILRGDIGEITHVALEMPQEGFSRCQPDGTPLVPQQWRLSDGEVPTVYLDLGVHLHQICHYLIGLKPLEAFACQASLGNFANVVDYVSANVLYENRVHATYYFGKSMLGFRNGLGVKIFGRLGSLQWLQSDPERIHSADRFGTLQILDRGGQSVAFSASRFARFKPGHPAGYVESFANLYSDIHTALISWPAPTTPAVGAELTDAYVALEGLELMSAMVRSSGSGKKESIR